MDKAKFHFVSEAAGSSTVVKVKTIQLIGQPEIFRFPQESQTSTQHKELFETTVTRGVVKSLRNRNKFRNVVITLTEELRAIYLDEEGNVVFNGYYLEACQADSSPLEQYPSPHSLSYEKPIHSITKSMVLEKYSGKNLNAESWLKTFVTECKRFEIDEKRYAEMLRLFLESSALEWYMIFLKTNGLTHAWEHWYNSFIDTFAQKSWVEITYAYTFKYLNGSFLDFALKKRNLLIDIDPDLTINSQINLIVISLPSFVKNRLNKKNLESMENLMAMLKQIEPFTNKVIKNYNEKNDDKQKNQQSFKPCSYCEKIGFPNRYHPEKLCRTKAAAEQKAYKNEKIRVVNNVEIQDAVARCEEAKNE